MIIEFPDPKRAANTNTPDGAPSTYNNTFDQLLQFFKGKKVFLSAGINGPTSRVHKTFHRTSYIAVG